MHITLGSTGPLRDVEGFLRNSNVFAPYRYTWSRRESLRIAVHRITNTTHRHDEYKRDYRELVFEKWEIEHATEKAGRLSDPMSETSTQSHTYTPDQSWEYTAS